MIDLLSVSGLPIALEHDRLTSYQENQVYIPEPMLRAIDAVRPYLKDPQARTSLKIVYTIYRGVNLRADKLVFANNGLRYDITIVYPGALGEELPKTIGHYHETKPGTKTSVPEIYEVLSGQAYFLFQPINAPEKNSELWLIEAASGDKVIVPPGFGHITINRGVNQLIIANIFSDSAESNYEFFEKHRGAAYYLLNRNNSKKPSTKSNADVILEKNGSYANIKTPIIARPKATIQFNLNLRKPLYTLFINNPDEFKFLNAPEEHRQALKPDNLFERAAGLSMRL